MKPPIIFLLRWNGNDRQQIKYRTNNLMPQKKLDIPLIFEYNMFNKLWKGACFMKKILSVLLVLCMLIPVAALGEADAFTSASVIDYFGTLMTPADLAASISAYNGFFAVATVNPDNTPNIGFFIFSAAEYEGKLYLQFGLAENQTRANMENGSAVTVMYAPLPTEGTYATVGARLTCERVTDEALVEKLMEIMPQKSNLIYEVTLIKPIG